jgi:hypothetical protein
MKKEKKLARATDAEVKAFTKKLGYEFSDEDVAHLRAESFVGETIEEAVDDYLRAYEA